MVLAPPPVHDSVVSPRFHGCLTFLHRRFPPQSPPSRPLGMSPHSQQQTSPWDCSTIPKLQLPAAVPSRGSMFLWGVHMTVARVVCVILIPCRLPRSAVSLSAFSVSVLIRQLPGCGDQTPASVPPPTKGRSSPTNTLIFSPSSFVLPSFG